MRRSSRVALRAAICESLRAKADKLAVRYLGAFQFSALAQTASELAECEGFSLPANLPFPARNLSIQSAIAETIQAAHFLAHSPNDIRAHLALKDAIYQVDVAIGRAADKVPASLLAANVEPPERVPFAAKRAPRETVLELSSGSAQMAGRSPHHTRDLNMRDARIVAILAKRRYRTTKNVSRRQIAELISEAQAMTDDQARNYIYC